jgi:ATP:corrinoid adenosyltransferase
LYGKFDFVATGLERFDGKKFRFENTDEDIAEAKEGLMLLKTALKKQTPVIAEELNTLVKTGLLNIDEIMEVLSNINYEVVVTGRYSSKEIIDISSTLVTVKEVKHYASSGHSVRKGIDF